MELLEQHFDTAFAAPDGIPRLRELIFKLAMQGKLVPQDPNESPANELLRSIEAEKKRLVKERKIKPPKILPEITASDEPYSLPHGWQWVRLGTIGNIFNGNSINASEKESKYAGVDGLPYIATKDVGYGFDRLDYNNGICIPPDEEKFRTAHQGAVLICAEGGSAGKKCGLTDRDICFGNKLFANELYGQIPSRFILYVYLSPAFRASFTAATTGIIGGVSIAKFVEIPIPLPPLDEQHRIVAKIDQLMAGCDELEKLRVQQAQKQREVHAAAVRQLLDAQSSDSFSGIWQFITQHFSDLYDVKENVAELRKTILQLALVGKLLAQNKEDEPAHLLMEQIRREKKTLIESGAIKKTRDEKDSASIPQPLNIPESWVSSSIGEIALLVTDGTHKTPRYVIEGVRFVSAKDIRDGYLSFDKCKYITAEEHEELARRCSPKRGDILVSKSGSIGTVVVVDDDGEFSLFESLALIKISRRHMNGQFMYYAVRNACNFLEDHHVKGVAVKHLHLNVLRTLQIPVPPLNEQHRIVSKIDQLMVLCDTLEQRIDDASSKQIDLLNAVMAQM